MAILKQAQDSPSLVELGAASWSFPPPRSPQELAVRLGHRPCAEEQAFLSRRKQVVAGALKQALQLDRDLREDEVWVWAGLGGTDPGLAWVQG